MTHERLGAIALSSKSPIVFLLQQVECRIQRFRLTLIVVLLREDTKFLMERLGDAEIEVRDFAIVEIADGVCGRRRLTLAAAGRWDLGHYAALPFCSFVTRSMTLCASLSARRLSVGNRV